MEDINYPSFFSLNYQMELIEKAKEIIETNWRGNFTVPTNKLYPFQWNWDSGFVSMGVANYDIEKTIAEIKSMFSGQWENGMLPHILFHSEREKTYFPNFDFWQSTVNQGAPAKPKSSGITQPPVYGFVLEDIFNKHHSNQSLIDFVKAIFPKLVAYHRFLYTFRDPNQEGLFYIFHPWESGRDNSPLWDESLNRIKIDKNTLTKYKRIDTTLADASERPTQDQYDRYVYLLELGKRYAYDGVEIAEQSPFLIQDCMMNAILIKSNESLINIGRALQLDVSEIVEWQEKSKANFSDKFWNEELGVFASYDMRSGEQLKHKEIGGFIPLFAGIATDNQAKRIADYLQSVSDKGYFLCPSFDIDSPLFDSKRYWRGPVWPHMNWMIREGLQKYGYHNLAETVKSDSLYLVKKLGFYEYFESQKSRVPNISKGYGGANFSWTASTIISFLSEPS